MKKAEKRAEKKKGCRILRIFAGSVIGWVIGQVIYDRFVKDRLK